MTPEERIKSFIRLSTKLLAQLRELSALHEQIRQIHTVTTENQEVLKSTSSGITRGYRRRLGKV